MHFYLEGGCSVRRQDGEPFLIVRVEDVVCNGDHRLKVHSIEQILFKYSRDSVVLNLHHNPALKSFSQFLWGKWTLSLKFRYFITFFTDFPLLHCPLNLVTGRSTFSITK